MKMYVFIRDHNGLHVAIPTYTYHGKSYAYYIRMSSGFAFAYFINTSLSNLEEMGLEIELPPDFEIKKDYTHEEIMALLPVEFSL